MKGLPCGDAAERSQREVWVAWEVTDKFTGGCPGDFAAQATSALTTEESNLMLVVRRGAQSGQPACPCTEGWPDPEGFAWSWKRQAPSGCGCRTQLSPAQHAALSDSFARSTHCRSDVTRCSICCTCASLRYGAGHGKILWRNSRELLTQQSDLGLAEESAWSTKAGSYWHSWIGSEFHCLQTNTDRRGLHSDPSGLQNNRQLFFP